jgi:hypothetical protein
VISRPLSSANRPPRSYISGGYLVRLGIEERLLSTGSSPALNDSASRVRLTAGPATRRFHAGTAARPTSPSHTPSPATHPAPNTSGKTTPHQRQCVCEVRREGAISAESEDRIVGVRSRLSVNCVERPSVRVLGVNGPTRGRPL